MTLTLQPSTPYFGKETKHQLNDEGVGNQYYWEGVGNQYYKETNATEN